MHMCTHMHRHPLGTQKQATLSSFTSSHGMHGPRGPEGVCSGGASFGSCACMALQHECLPCMRGMHIVRVDILLAYINGPPQSIHHHVIPIGAGPGMAIPTGGGESPLTHPPKMGGRVHAKQQPHPPKMKTQGGRVRAQVSWPKKKKELPQWRKLDHWQTRAQSSSGRVSSGRIDGIDCDDI